MKLDFLILADGANVGEGKVYIHGGAITRATFHDFPSQPMLLTAVARFLLDEDERGNPQRREVTFEMARADGTAVTLGAGQLSWEPVTPIREDEDQAAVLVAPMLIVFERPGRYELRLHLDGELVGARGLAAVQAEDKTPAS